MSITVLIADDHPVVCVSWQDARAYVAWLRERSRGELYRLLSEAEWEFCCRAGTTSRYSIGDEITPTQANFGNNSKGTTSVAKYAPNPWGFRDLHGNVWEWCEDYWHQNYQDAPADGSVWAGGDLSLRLLRGGSWISRSENLRSAWRDGYTTDFRSNYLGFRVGRALLPP